MWIVFNTALIAYDCNGTGTNVTVFSLRDVAPCPDPETAYREDNTYVQILQRVRTAKIPVSSCYVEVLRFIFKCGMFSHLTGAPSMVMKTLQPVGAEECQRLHRTRTYHGYAGAVVANLRENGTTTASVTVAGSLDGNGHCEGGTYTENEVTWERVVVTASISITMSQYWATASFEDGTIHLQGRLVCKFADGYCLDAAVGENVWKTDVAAECDRYQVLFEGSAAFVTSLTSKKQFLVVEHRDKVFALNLRKLETICYQSMWLTEHPRLLVYPVDVTRGKIFASPHNVEDVDLLTHLNAKFFYVEQSYKRALQRVYADTVHRRCMLNREILRTQLALAPLAPSTVGGLLKRAPGFVGRVLGEVLYVMQCAPTIVEVRRTTKCYVELPVMTMDNKSLFLSPVSRVLQPYGSEVECAAMAVPMYFVDNEWVGFHPRPVPSNKPVEISPEVEPSLDIGEIQELGRAGLYTREEMREMQQVMSYGASRQAVSDIIVRRAMGVAADDQGLKFSRVFSQIDLQSIAEDTARRVWGWLAEIGLVSSGFIGLYTVLRLIKYLFGVVINGFTLHAATGWSVYLLACLWDALTVWAVGRQPARSSASGAKEEDPEPGVVADQSQDAVKEAVRTAPKRSPTLYPYLGNVSNPRITATE